MDNKKVLFGLLALIIISGLSTFLIVTLRKPKTTTAPTLQVQPETREQVQTTSPTLPPPVIPTSNTTIIATSKGFDPQTITVKQKTQVIWTNESGEDVSVNSIEHPTHQVYRPLNLGRFPTGQSVSLTFTTPGTYSYHNHFHPERTGTVIVE